MTRKVISIFILGVSVASCLVQSTYSHYTIEVVIPYYPDPMNADVPFTAAPRVRVNMQNGNASTSYHPIIDTGTCGYVVSIDSFPSWSQSLADTNEVGWEFLSSSKKLYSGHWIPVDMSFPDALVETNARVPVLVVEDVTICPHYNSTSDRNICPPVDGNPPNVIHHPTSISLFGIGFGRRRDGQPQGTPDKNPFLNILSRDGTATANNGLFRNGYILDRTGIRIGLTGSNTRDIIHWHSLGRGTLWHLDHRDWGAIRTCLSVDANPCVQGTLLIDTGIPQSYLTLPKSTVIRSHLDTNPSSHATVPVLDDGTIVHLKVRDDIGFAVDDNFVVGNPEGIEKGIVPNMVIVSLRDESVKKPFLNTGRHFLREWTIAFDADGGRFGFQRAMSFNQSMIGSLHWQKLV